MSLKQWFRQIWVDDRARAVLGEYAAIGAQFQLFLADVAARGGVFAEPAPSATEYEAGYDAGRRAHALETIHLCSTSPSALLELIPKNPELVQGGRR